MKTNLIVLLAAVGLALQAWAQTAAPNSAPSADMSPLLDQLKTTSKSSGDAQLNSLSGDLSSKVQALHGSLKGNSAAQSQLQSTVQSLLGGKGADSLGSLQKLTEAKLTPEQMKLAKEVGNVGSAYVVQKNFGALEGAQGDVAQIVNSLRKGQPTAALPAIQKVAQNAKLTPAQKDLIGSLADKYAPGTKKAGAAVTEGLKSIPGLGK